MTGCAAARAWEFWEAAGIALAVGATAGCARPSQTSSYALIVHVESDPGRPLPGATVSFSGDRVGTTGDAGTLALAIRGTEGEHLSLAVSCPDGFRSPAEPSDVVLHRLAEPGRKPEYELACPPVKRSVVVVVRADGGPGLPVVYLGKVIARTDEAGAAHARIDVPANEDVEIALSTNEPGSERLRPKNPSIKFVASDQNDVKLFSVQFQQEVERHRAPAARALPVRLN